MSDAPEPALPRCSLLTTLPAKFVMLVPVNIGTFFVARAVYGDEDWRRGLAGFIAGILPVICTLVVAVVGIAPVPRLDRGHPIDQWLRKHCGALSLLLGVISGGVFLFACEARESMAGLGFAKLQLIHLCVEVNQVLALMSAFPFYRHLPLRGERWKLLNWVVFAMSSVLVGQLPLLELKAFINSSAS